MTISGSSTLCTNVLLIFEIHDLSGALFSNATFFSALSFSFAVVTKRSIVPFTTIYALLQSHKSDLKPYIFVSRTLIS